MGNASWSSGRSPNFRPLPEQQQLSDDPEAEEGPDEQTGMFMKGNPRDYQATRNAVSHRSSAGGRASSDASRPGGTAGAGAGAAAAANGNGLRRRDAGAHDESEKQGWGDYFSGLWSIELENKGSVARDHLALGEFPWSFPNFYFPKHDWLTLPFPLRYREDVPRVAQDFAGFRVDWHRRHPAVPPQHVAVQRPGRRVLSHDPAAGQAAWRRVPRHFHPGLVLGLPEICAEPAVGDEGKVPSV
jgi:hypothetical protein